MKFLKGFFDKEITEDDREKIEDIFLTYINPKKGIYFKEIFTDEDTVNSDGSYVFNWYYLRSHFNDPKKMIIKIASQSEPIIKDITNKFKIRLNNIGFDLNLSEAESTRSTDPDEHGGWYIIRTYTIKITKK
jgi:hypothetical protein